ncbi:hypothetical protein ColLi_01467 [Colletotrichum liriopes]|uniref:Uncharacterized protein n=1 Tax=Colletotrichum liriopes TaxID=708192 RepID=A0AA37GCZ7_9PEZI|nr:hypothetical protein ColLi_01467 [Colletotrichum liriopes]
MWRPAMAEGGVDLANGMSGRIGASQGGDSGARKGIGLRRMQVRVPMQEEKRGEALAGRMSKVRSVESSSV